MKKFLLSLFLIILVSTACKQPDEDKAQDEKPEQSDKMEQDTQEIAARVNGIPILKDELKGTSLENAINNELLYQKALENNIDKEIEKQLKIYKKNLIIKTYKEHLRKSESDITENDIQSYYDKHKGEYINILVKELIIKDKTTAEEAYKEASAGMDFDQLIEKYVNKGNAHSHTKTDPPYKDLFFDKQQGAVEMFEHPEGYKIAKLIEKHEIPMARIKKFIVSKLNSKTGEEKINSLIQQIKGESSIEILVKDSMGHGEHSGHLPEKVGLTKDEFLEDTNQCLKITNPSERADCMQPYFNALTHEKSVAYTLELARILEDEGIIRDCHMVAHHAGMSVLEKSNYDVEKAFASCTPDCFQGCYHAVLQNYVNYAKWKPEEIPQKATETCNKISRNEKLPNRQCIHGVGHGMVTNYYMPVVKASEICRKLDGSMRVNACLGGVFMEQANREILPYDENEMLQRLPLICKADELNDDVLIQKCAHAVGEGVMFFSGHDVEKSKQLCQNLDSNLQESCVKAAIEMHTASE